MKTSEYTTTLLKAEDGQWLTQSADVDLMERSFYSQLCLAKSSQPSDYKEVSDEYKKDIEEKQNAVREEERQKRIAEKNKESKENKENKERGGEPIE